MPFVRHRLIRPPVGEVERTPEVGHGGMEGTQTGIGSEGHFWFISTLAAQAGIV